ncbi:regulatory LuxR family protein [Actinocorallia herbida]|uniref:Regulatory LuxR family protein n=1 Tax=Actinocorallia herbida TaxID=58109 RepID=A0A3N1CWD2_9ACTN|nr:LuxR family transcriptional regulator [Actinocorallia herbida]ROO85597.1 regulatory LuxR family protein [Actinocorallia herbida]
MTVEVFYGGSGTVRVGLLDRLHALTSAPGEEGRLIAVVGEPGSGKTRLLAALVRERRWSALPAAFHRCAGEGADQPSPADLARRPSSAPTTIAASAPRPEPVRPLVVLEDAHLAGAATVRDLVAHAHAAPAPPVDVVLALRPGQAAPELAEAIALTEAFGRTVRIELPPLTDEQMTALAPVPFELRRRSGGNPFRLLALQALERAAGTGDAAEVAPFEFAVLHETRGLGGHERAVLHAAAVLRDGFDVALLAEVAEVGQGVAAAAARGLVRRGLLRVEEPVETLFAIRDEVFGTLLRRTIDPVRAERAHRRAVGLLSARAQDGRRLGFHLASLPPRTGEPARILSAAEELMDEDLAEAVYCLTPVLAETAAGDPLGARARLALSTAFGRLGRLAESRDLLFAVHEACLARPDADAEALAAAVAFVSGAEAVLSQDVQTLDLLQEYAGRPELRGGPVGPLLLFALGFRSAMVGGPPDAAGVAEGLAACGATSPLRAGLLALSALAALADGRTSAAAEQAGEAGRLLDRLPEHQAARYLETVCAYALATLYLGRHGEAQRQLRRAIAVARRRERTHLLPTLLVLTSEAERHLGLLSAARDAADAAVIESPAGNTLRQAQALALKAAAEVWAQPAGSGRARALAEQALARKTPLRVNANGSAALAVFALAQAAWLDGDPGHCVALLLDEGRGPGLSGVPSGQRTAVWELLCAAGMDAGLALEPWVAACVRHAAEAPLPHHRGHAALAQGHLCRVRGSLAEAERRYLEAAAAFASAGMAVAQSRALGHRAAVLAGLGRAGDAAQAVDLALAIARRVGAERLTAWLRARIGGPEDGDPVTAWESYGRLTGREREVALLLCAGLSRREIAARLTISPRTVDVHLTRVYRKAGVRSRMQLALALRDAGRAPHPDRSSLGTAASNSRV